jgi:hypothetical protein
MYNDDYDNYWCPAREKLGFEGMLRGSQKLAKLLGMYYPVINVVPLTDAQKQILKMLAGPHSETIVKMLKIKREENERETHD